VIKKMLWGLAYTVSMPVAVVLITIGYYFYKNHLMPVPHPSKIELEISEIAHKSQEIMALFWQKYHKCPVANDIEAIELLPLVAKVSVNQPTAMSCKLTIHLKKENVDKALAGKKIEQTYHFKALTTSDKLYQWSCYTDAVEELVPMRCKKFRDIESYLKD